jgi:ribonucleoside-diphosphate reductase alpha chain
MGFADMLIKLNIQYDTDEAVKCATDVMRFIHTTSLNVSRELADTRGVFPAWRGSRWQSEVGIRLRNSALTTVAPTGTLSIIANCSSGCEPYYSKSTKKHILDTILDTEVEYAKSDCFITAHEITPDWHVRIQSAFQLNVDSAVSKTINFPNEATEDDVRKAILLAYKMKCKGITVYRDNSRKKQVLNSAPVAVEDKCPDCGSPVINESGCVKCSKDGCGWSACKIA